MDWRYMTVMSLLIMPQLTWSQISLTDSAVIGSDLEGLNNTGSVSILSVNVTEVTGDVNVTIPAAVITESNTGKMSHNTTTARSYPETTPLYTTKYTRDDDTLTCGDPPMIHHADYNHSESHYRLGYVIIYRCHRGFFPSVNPLIVTCLQRDSPAGLETGVWVRPEEDGEFLCLLSKEIKIAVASVCVIILGAVILTLVVMAIRHHLKYRGGHGNFVMLDDMMENSADD